MKKILKKLIAVAAHYLGLWYLVFGCYRLLTGKHLLVAFMYHRIVDGAKTKGYYTSYERGLDVAVFERHLRCIKRHFTVVSLAEFIDFVTGRKKLTGHTALITFDDADSEYPKYAFPLVKKHRLAAVVFAPTAYVGTDELLWPIKVSNIIRHATKNHWKTIQEKADRLPENIRRLVMNADIDRDDCRPSLGLAINLGFDEVDHETVDRTIELWHDIVKPRDSLPIRCMTWDDLRLLEESRNAVESHTVTHRKLTRLTAAEIQEELITSKKQLETKLQKTVKSLCYPQGWYNDTVCEVAHNCGYHVGFTTRQAICTYPIKGRDLFKIPRLSVDGESLSEIQFFLGRIAAQDLFQRRPKEHAGSSTAADKSVGKNHRLGNKVH
jgi:peptidoglycan/xylan/chitin deacetylase (PgdA/CDA1 family)